VDSGGIPEMVRHGETGLLVGSRDPVAMAQAAARLVSVVALAHQVWEAVKAYTRQRVRGAWAGAYAGGA